MIGIRGNPARAILTNNPSATDNDIMTTYEQRTSSRRSKEEDDNEDDDIDHLLTVMIATFEVLMLKMKKKKKKKRITRTIQPATSTIHTMQHSTDMATSNIEIDTVSDLELDTDIHIHNDTTLEVLTANTVISNDHDIHQVEANTLSPLKDTIDLKYIDTVATFNPHIKLITTDLVAQNNTQFLANICPINCCLINDLENTFATSLVASNAHNCNAESHTLTNNMSQASNAELTF
jgi:hypothetical protein